jgi:hypothetical protein
MIDIVTGLFPDPVRLLAIALMLLAGAVLALGMLEVLLFTVSSIVLSRREGRSKAPPDLAVLVSALALGVGSSLVSPPGAGAQEVPTIEARFTRLISSDSMTLLNPVLSPDRRWIAFATFAEGRADIWTVSAEGGDPIRLTNGRHLSQYPQWFPSGDRIVFLSDQVAEEPGLLLYLMSIPIDPETGRATGAARQVSLEPAREYAVSPDGQWIAYGTYVLHGKLQVIPSEGGAARTLFDESDGGSPHIPAWSKDSRYLYFAVSPSSDSTRLMRVGLEGGAVEEISSIPGDVWAIGPDARFLIRELDNGPGQTRVTEFLSQGGQPLGRIPLHRNMNGAYPTGFTSDGTATTAAVGDIVSSVFVSSLEDGSVRKISDGGPTESPLGWTPDSRQVFSRTVLNGQEAVLLSPIGGGPALEIPLPAEATDPIVPSADGEYVAYGLGPMADTGQTVMVRRISDGETRVLTHHLGWGLRFGGEVLGPGGGVTDGNDFLFVERHGNRVELRASPPEGPSGLLRSVVPGLAVEIPRDADRLRGVFSLGVHGDWVAFAKYPDEYPLSAETTLFLSTGEGEVPRALASVPGGLEGIYWSRDRRWIVAGHYTPQAQSFKFDLLLVGVTPEGTLASGPRILETEAWVPNHIRWLPDNQTLAVFGLAKEGLANHLWLLPISGEEAAAPVALGDPSATWWANLSPDGRKVAFGEQTRRGSSIWLVDYGEFLREQGLVGR